MPGVLEVNQLAIHPDCQGRGGVFSDGNGCSRRESIGVGDLRTCWNDPVSAKKTVTGLYAKRISYCRLQMANRVSLWICYFQQDDSGAVFEVQFFAALLPKAEILSMLY